MARIRSIKPEYWGDRKLAKRLSRDARLLYIALWNLADEHARLNGDPQWVKGQAFPYDDDLDVMATECLLKELAAIERVVMYETDGDPYLFLPKLAEHQRLEPEKVRSRLPDPPPCGPGADPCGPGADPSEPRADESARGADKAGNGADGSAPGDGSPALLYVAGSREHGAGSRDARVVRATPLGNALLRKHVDAITPAPPRDVQQRTGEKIDSLLDEGFDADVITEALARLRRRPDLGPGILPGLVHEINQERAGNTGEARASPARDRRQEATNQKFERAMARARAKDAQEGQQ